MFLGKRTVLLAVGWFAVMLSPTMNVVPVGVLVAEGCLYLPVLGATILAAGLMKQAFRCYKAVIWWQRRWRLAGAGRALVGAGFTGRELCIQYALVILRCVDNPNDCNSSSMRLVCDQILLEIPYSPESQFWVTC
jgi:hypothetical protein